MEETDADHEAEEVRPCVTEHGPFREIEGENGGGHSHGRRSDESVLRLSRDEEEKQAHRKEVLERAGRANVEEVLKVRRTGDDGDSQDRLEKRRPVRSHDERRGDDRRRQLHDAGRHPPAEELAKVSD